MNPGKGAVPCSGGSRGGWVGAIIQTTICLKVVDAFIQLAVVGVGTDSPEARPADVRQPGAEAVAQQAEEPEDHVAVGAGVSHDPCGIKLRLLLQDYGEEDEATPRTRT